MKRFFVTVGLIVAGLMGFSLIHSVYQNHGGSPAVGMGYPKHSREVAALVESVVRKAALIQEAHASGGPSTLKSLVRFFYFMIAGWPDDATYLTDNNCTAVDGCDGPPRNGMLGFVNELAAGIGEMMGSGGYATCGDIPTTGSISGAVAAHDAGSPTVTVTFGAPTHTIPASYPGGDGTATYEKKIQVAMGTVTIMDMEFTCSRSAGWVGFNFPEGGTGTAYRIIEMYFDAQDTAATQVDFHMRYDASSERFVLKFEKNSETDFSYWAIRVGADSGNTGGFRFVVRGDATSGAKRATAFMQYFTGASLTALAADGRAASTSLTHDAGDDVGNGVIFCVDSGTPSFGVGCSGLSVSSPAPAAPLIDSAGALTIGWVADDTAGLASKIFSP